MPQPLKWPLEAPPTCNTGMAATDSAEPPLFFLKTGEEKRGKEKKKRRGKEKKRKDKKIQEFLH